MALQTSFSKNDVELDKEFLQKLIEAIKKTKFGSIEIVIHDSRIVQIETREKYRFELRK
ncbi:MAG: DUF2292 domain-containing protein [Balneolaceae bacterium]|nr:MAG: DUF2292 domain-containing protein [Balneolaceae bacterium]